MIVEEKISGTLCRYHADENDPEYQGQWILTDDGEIKGLMILKASPGAFREFGAWIQRQKKPLSLTTAIRSVATIMKRLGFIEMKKE